MTSQQTSPSRGPRSPQVTGFYDPDTGSIQYVVTDPGSGKAAIIDPVWNFDPRSARTDTRSADEILQHVSARGISVDWILDTHPHADHFTAGAYLKGKLGAPHAIGEKVRDVAALWRGYYNAPKSFGALPRLVMMSPGHTIASLSGLVGDDGAFVHDTLMMPDSGSSRADFPGGDAATLYRSIQTILALPSQTRLFVGHDYGKDGRAPQWEATVAEHRASNIHVKDGISEAEYVKMRTGRDRMLPLPDRMLHALQVNLRGGRLPEPEDDGHSYFRIPANRF